MLVDSHAHLDSPELSDALDEIIDRAREASRHFSPMGPEKAALFGIKRFE